MFYNKRQLIKNKSTVIIRKLSSSLKPEKLFVTLASNLLNFEDPVFISTMVKTLDFLLLTEKVKFNFSNFHIIRIYIF